jgi:hypothetical protein
MIITDRFVMLNFPKTGSSFARKALRKIHRYETLPNRILRKLNVPQSSMIELSLPSVDRRFPDGLQDQHGTYRQIPEGHRHKTVVSIIRNPFDRYVSAYLFGWWKTNLPTTEKRLLEAFPNFPDLSFREYYEMTNLFGRENRLRGLSPRIDLGFYTIQFVQFFFQDPERALRRIDGDYITRKRYLDDMAELVFLHQENLNSELYDFLLAMGYPEADIAFIHNAERVNVTPRAENQCRWEDLLSADLQEDILNKDRLVFDIFPEYGIVSGTAKGDLSPAR